MKQCYICKIEKEDSEFRLQKTARISSVYFRLCSYCKDCEKKQKHVTNKIYHNKKKQGFIFVKKNRDLKKYRQDNAAYFAAKASERRADLKNRTPVWADRELILEIYKTCPKEYEVDHIVPLCGSNVCGLHVEYNLQYLTPEENRYKSNLFPYGDYF